MIKIKWVRFDVGMFDNPKIKQIDSMENRDVIHYIWVSTILLAGKCNCDGGLYLTENIPYTIKTLAVEFRRSVDEVKEAFKVFQKYKMIDVTEDKVFYICGWQKHQNVDGLEKIRKQTNERVMKYRARKREEKRLAEEQKKGEEGINNNHKSCCKDNSPASDNVQKNNVAEDRATTGDYDNKDFGAADVTKKDKIKNNENETDAIKHGEIKNNVTKDGHIECNNAEINSNVTCNVDNNVTSEQNIHPVTHKNKKQNKIKKLREEKDNKHNPDLISEDNHDITSNNKSHSSKESESVSEPENIYSKAIELAAYCEKLTGRIGLLDISGLNMAVEIHGSENVKKAIEKAIENGTIKLNYIMGILRNWAKEGYPEDECDYGISGGKNKYGKCDYGANRSKKKYGECDSGIKGSNKKYGGGNGYGAECSSKGSGPDKNEFKGIRPGKPRKLSEEERRKASANVV